MDFQTYEKLMRLMYIEQRFEDFFWVVNHAEYARPHTIVEIGVKHGGSLKFWEQITQPGDKIIGVDADVDVPNKIQWDWRHSDRNIHIVIGDSSKPETVNRVKEILGDKQVDFLMIDGHHRDGVPELDFKNFVPLVRIKGCVCIADLGCPCASHVFNALPEPKDADPTAGMGMWWKKSNDNIDIPPCIGEEEESYAKVLKKYHGRRRRTLM